MTTYGCLMANGLIWAIGKDTTSLFKDLKNEQVYDDTYYQESDYGDEFSKSKYDKMWKDYLNYPTMKGLFGFVYMDCSQGVYDYVKKYGGDGTFEEYNEVIYLRSEYDDLYEDDE